MENICAYIQIKIQPVDIGALVRDLNEQGRRGRYVSQLGAGERVTECVAGIVLIELFCNELNTCWFSNASSTSIN